MVWVTLVAVSCGAAAVHQDDHQVPATRRSCATPLARVLEKYNDIARREELNALSS